MPEGPEVEFTLRSLKVFEGMEVESITLTKLSQKYNKYKGKQKDFLEFSSSILEKLERHGKFIVWIFNNGKTILNHLGMSGKWLIYEGVFNETKAKHAKVIVNFKGTKKAVVFDDARNFGQFRIFENYFVLMNYTPIKKIGLDGLSLPFPIFEFKKIMKLKRISNKEIGKVLLDQSVISGIGNIYKSETLFLAKIDPTRIVKTLKTNEIEMLAKAIPDILNKAVKSMGSTINSYRNPYGEEGSAQKWHKVYGKEGEKCEECGTKILRIIQNKRSTFYCKKCQS